MLCRLPDDTLVHILGHYTYNRWVVGCQERSAWREGRLCFEVSDQMPTCLACIVASPWWHAGTIIQ